MQKSKTRGGGERVFTAPFPLKLCENRLESKRERSKSLWFGSGTEVYTTEESGETVSFIVSKGGALVKGRLDRLTPDSTLVSLKSGFDWMSYGSMVLWYSPLALALCLPVLFVAAYILVRYAGHPTIMLTPDLLLGMVLMLTACIALYAGWWTRHTRHTLARSVERGLTDPAADLPEFLQAEVGADGELVPAPTLQAGHDSPQDLDDLLKRKRS